MKNINRYGFNLNPVRMICLKSAKQKYLCNLTLFLFKHYGFDKYRQIATKIDQSLCLESLKWLGFYNNTSCAKVYCQQNTAHIKERGFVLVILIPFIFLMILSFSGLFLMGFAIKNFTIAQTACIKSNLKGQKKLGHLLELLLNLNPISETLHKKRLALQGAIAVAAAHGNIKAISALRKILKIIKKQQKVISVRQKQLLFKGQKVKSETLKDFRRSIKKLKIKNPYEVTVFKKALAVEEKPLSKSASIYEPLADFSKKQATVFSWKIDLLSYNRIPASLQRILSSYRFFSTYNCTATLERRQNIWKTRIIP